MMGRTSVFALVLVLGAVLTEESGAYSLGYWAHPQYKAGVYRSPDPQSKRIGRLHWYTEDGFLEVYRITSRPRRGRDGQRWVRIQMPRRPRALSGWIRLSGVDYIRTSSYRLYIHRRYHVAHLYKKKGARWYRVWQARIAIGKPGTPTPGGIYWVRERIRNLHSSAVYGPWAFGTSAYSRLSDWPGGGVIGLHGTNRPWLLGGNVSHGCIRMSNPSIRALARHLEVGTPLLIR